MGFSRKLGFHTPFHCFPMTSQTRTEMYLPLPHTHLVFSNSERKARKTGLLLIKAEEVFHFHLRVNEQQPNRRENNELLLGLSCKCTCLWQYSECQGCWYLTRKRMSFEKHFDIFQRWWERRIQASLQYTLKIMSLILSYWTHQRIKISGTCIFILKSTSWTKCVCYRNLFSYCHLSKSLSPTLPQPQNSKIIRERISLLTTF